jgi:hypothetical protein
LSWRPLRTSCWMVGTASFSFLSSKLSGCKTLCGVGGQIRPDAP